MKKIGIYLVFIFIPMLGIGQTAAEIIGQFKQYVQSTKQYTTQFSYSLIVPQEKINYKDEGKSWVKDQWAKLELKSHTIYMDGQSRWTYTPATDEVVITKLGSSPEDLLANPNLLIMRYLKSTNAKLIEKSGSKEQFEILLSPKDARSTFKQIILVLDAQSYAPLQIHYSGKDASQMHVKFVKFNQISGAFPIHEVSYNPQKYKQAEIIDMR